MGVHAAIHAACFRYECEPRVPSETLNLGPGQSNALREKCIILANSALWIEKMFGSVWCPMASSKELL